VAGGLGSFLADTWQAIREAFSERPPPAPVQPCPCPVFEARIVGVRFLSPVRVARRGAAIAGEHWTEGVDVREPRVADGSTKPAVVRIAGRGEPGVRLRIRVTRSVGVGPTGPVTGTLGGLAFAGLAQCPTSVGDHVVDARIVLLHPHIARDAGDAAWQIEVDPLGVVSLGATRLELVTVLDTPVRCFASGVWIEVLRLLLARAGVAGIDTRRAAAAAVARFGHTGLALSYDTVGGSPRFNSGTHGANGYLLARLISPIANKVVNCYDMAAAVSAMAGALGVNLGWKYMDPFGYLAPSSLIGVGQCNNPFFRGEAARGVPAWPTPMAPPNDARRTSFGNHAFTSFTTLGNANLSGTDTGPAEEAIGDACAGPATFDVTLAQYVLNAVDQNRPYTRARADALARYAAIAQWEQQQLAAVAALPNPPITDEQKRGFAATVRALAEQARVQAAADLAATETSAVQDGVGLNSVQFTDYSGP
jgi:hypothetical protein